MLDVDLGTSLMGRTYDRRSHKLVMPGLVPGIHAFLAMTHQRRKWPGQAGHDGQRTKLISDRKSFDVRDARADIGPRRLVRCELLPQIGHELFDLLIV